MPTVLNFFDTFQPFQSWFTDIISVYVKGCLRQFCFLGMGIHISNNDSQQYEKTQGYQFKGLVYRVIHDSFLINKGHGFTRIIQIFELSSLRSQPVESLKVVRLESWNNGMMEYWVHSCSIWLKNNKDIHSFGNATVATKGRLSLAPIYKHSWRNSENWSKHWSYAFLIIIPLFQHSIYAA